MMYAERNPGEVVLDQGSGGGIDVMLALARQNAQQAGITNVEFLRGRLEDIPLPSESVDVIVSSCVIHLAGDKRQVLAEAFRVLEPRGRFAVSDVVVRGEVPARVRHGMELRVGCVAGALEAVPAEIAATLSS